MSEKNICPVHGEKNANESYNYSATKAEKLGHPELTVDPDCTCDVGATGPALTGGNVPVGPAADPQLVAKGSGAYDHPQTPAPTGPAAEIK